MEQTFLHLNTTTALTEYVVFDYVKAICAGLGVDESILSLTPATKTSSKGIKVVDDKKYYVNLNNTSLIVIKIMKTGMVGEMKATYEKLLDNNNGLPTVTTSGVFRHNLQNYQDLEKLHTALKSAIMATLKNREFDCCSKYRECSATGHCIHENKTFAWMCTYADNLRNGKNFYSPK